MNATMVSSRRFLIAGVVTLLYAAFTLGMLLLYVKTAMAMSHGASATRFTTLSQHAKAIFLWPILLPLLRNRPDLLSGWLAILFLLLNSLLWIVVVAWVYRLFYRRHAAD